MEVCTRELTGLYGAIVELAQLLDGLDEEAELGKDLLEHLHVLVVHGEVQQVIEAEAARDDEHETLVQLRRYLKQQLVVVVKLEAIVLDVIYHAYLLLVEELPDVEYFIQMVARHFIKVALL